MLPPAVSPTTTLKNPGVPPGAFNVNVPIVPFALKTSADMVVPRSDEMLKSPATASVSPDEFRASIVQVMASACRTVVELDTSPLQLTVEFVVGAAGELRDGEQEQVS